MNAALLEDIGLTKGEIAVYFALLETGSSTVGPIIDKSKISSSKIYSIIERLISKGLATYSIHENRKYFDATSPERILDYLHEKEQAIKKQSEEVERALPELLLKQKLSKQKQEVNIYEGSKGIRSLHAKVLRRLHAEDAYDIMGALPDTPRMEHHSQSKGIRSRQLIPQGSHSVASASRALPPGFSLPSWIEIADDTAVIGIPSSTPIALEITNAKVANSFRSYFNMLWNQKVRVCEGWKQVTEFFNQILDDLKPEDEYFVLNANQGIESLPELASFFKEFHIRRAKKGVKLNALFNQNMRPWMDDIARKPADVRFLPPDFQSPMQMTFYRDKLYISIWSKDAIGFLIQRIDVVKAVKAYFDVLWNSATLSQQ